MAPYLVAAQKTNSAAADAAAVDTVVAAVALENGAAVMAKDTMRVEGETVVAARANEVVPDAARRALSF